MPMQNPTPPRQTPVARLIILVIAFFALVALAMLTLIATGFTLNLHSKQTTIQNIIFATVLAAFLMLLFIVYRSGKENERRSAELEDSRHKYEKLFSSITDAVLIFCPETGDIVDLNTAAEKLYDLNREELLSMQICDLVENPEEFKNHVLENSAELSKRILTQTHKSKLGKEIIVEISTGIFNSTQSVKAGENQLAVSIIRNISLRKKLETRLRQSERMESIGQLAGGVAHDFRNQLTVVTGYCDLLLHEYSHDGNMLESVEQISDAAKRATNITQQLLAFSRKQSLNPEDLDLNEIIHSLSKPLSRMIGERIQINYSTCAHAFATVDRTQFEQAIVNLAINARDAMPEGGQLEISTKLIKLSKADAMHFPNISAGDYILLEVEDTGTGMSSEVASRIFEPFFTTKKAGKGTGLGLATVYGFVMQSSGHIEAKSAPDKGAKFRIYLPALAKNFQTSDLEPAQNQKPMQGSEIILLVEDDDSVRQLVAKVLLNCGYKVLQASNAQEAIPLGEHYEAQIDLLITDVIMPKMNGPELASRLKQARPNMKVLFISGYSGQALTECGLEITADNFLTKPFNPSDLSNAARKLLD